MKINNSIIHYYSHNIIIFKLDDYFSHLFNKIILRFAEWDLLKKKINLNSKQFKFFAELELQNLIETVKVLYNKENIKIYMVSSPFKFQEKLYDGWIDDFEVFKKKILNFLKKKTKYLIILNKDIRFENFVFKNNINYGIPTGEEIEFLQTLG